ncbi:MAG: hypothetical protein J6Y23_07190, partial [Prevotella sp.]|nr:hypothetical protein [Prevotella sp.]
PLFIHVDAFYHRLSVPVDTSKLEKVSFFITAPKGILFLFCDSFQMVLVDLSQIWKCASSTSAKKWIKWFQEAKSPLSLHQKQQ